MVTVPTDRLIIALRELEPGQRALLNLSLHHRVLDDELAGLMGLERSAIADRRSAAIDRLVESPSLAGAVEPREVERVLTRLSAEEWTAAALAPAAAKEPRAGPHAPAPPPEDDERVEAPSREQARDGATSAGTSSPLAGSTDDGPEDEWAPSPEAESEAARAASTGTDGSITERRPEDADAAAPPGRQAAEAAPVASPETARAEEPGAAAPKWPPDRPIFPSPPARRRRHRLGPALLALAVLAGAAVALGILVGGSEEPDGPTARETPPFPSPAGSPQAGRAGAAGPPVPLRPVTAGVRARGTARVVGSGPEARIELSVRWLSGQNESYEVWLYNSIGDAVTLGRFERPQATLTLHPRGRLRDYRLLDISLQPPGAGRNHSGQSILRVPTARLARSG